jgi:hypothetical protein
VVRFRVTVLSLLAGIAVLGFLSLSFAFPEARAFAAVGPLERFVAVGIEPLPPCVVVWNATTTTGDVVADRSRRRRGLGN